MRARNDVKKYLDNTAPVLSIIILNYNGAPWLVRCLDSIKAQTIFPQIELIIADNLSTDGSDQLAEELLKDWPNGRFLQNGGNLGFCEGNNRAVPLATGKWLFFLNNDTWLEPDCLEKLLEGVQRAQAQAASPLVLNYADDSPQVSFGVAFDIFGLPVFGQPPQVIDQLFMPAGCSYLIEANLFRELGGFDKEIYLYSDELDLSWRVWLSGHRCAAVQTARMHHRLAANVNPKGGGAVVEYRTSDSKRFYANRNSLLVLLKNARHILLLLVPLQLCLLAAEAVAGLVLLRRWGFVKRTFLDALTDLWRLRGHIFAERRRMRAFRKRGDLWMLRFLTWRMNRWREIQQVIRHGPPKVTPK